MIRFLNPKVFIHDTLPVDDTLPVTDSKFAEGVIESIANVPYGIV